MLSPKENSTLRGRSTPDFSGEVYFTTEHFYFLLIIPGQMFPVKSNATRGFPAITLFLIVLCCLVFLKTDALQGYAGGTVPVDLAYLVFHPSIESTKALVALFVSMFLHGSLLHLLSNMWFLWVFGPPVEKRFGAPAFLVFFLICGALSMIIQAVSDPLSPIPIVGASGAIAGVMGAHLFLAPLARIIVWLPPVFFFPVPSLLFLILWFCIQYMNIRTGNPSGGSSVAWWAHAGGFVSGALWVLICFAARRNMRSAR